MVIPTIGGYRRRGLAGILMLSRGGSRSTRAMAASRCRTKCDEGVVISDHKVSLLEPSQREEGYRAQLLDFMETNVYPAEPVYEAQMRESGDPHHQPEIIEDLKREARRRGLWSLFHPHPQWGPGLSNLEYAPLA